MAATTNATTNAASATPPAHAPKVAAKPVVPTATLTPAMQRALGRYGDIVQPSDQTIYPLHLRLPIPAEMEVRVPSPDVLAKRAKLEALVNLSDDEIHKQLAAWPAYNKMSIRDQGIMLQRIQDFRDYHAHYAAQQARDLGLPPLPPVIAAEFEKEYWDKRLKIDQDLAQQFMPVYEAREQQMDAELVSEFTNLVPAPSAPKPAPKPSAASATSTATPVAQSPR